MKKFYPVRIERASNGIVVHCGCLAPFVYQQDQLDIFLRDLNSYLRDPKGTQAQILSRWEIEEEAHELEHPVGIDRASQEPEPIRERIR